MPPVPSIRALMVRKPAVARRSIISSNRREEQLLAWLCAARLSHRAAAPPPSLDAIDWTRLENLACFHRVVPLIWCNLQSGTEVSLPGPFAARLRQLHQLNGLSALRLASHLANTMQAFSAAEIPVVPLKGVALASLYYGSIAARHAGDADLLVAPADLQRADTVLRSSGHLPVSSRTHQVMPASFSEDLRFVHHLSYLGPNRIPVELHVRLHPNPELLRVDVEELISTGQLATVGRARLPVMADDLQFLFLATHGARHDWERLQWVCDIAVMADMAGEHEVRRWLGVAKDRRLTNPAVQAVVMAHRLLGTRLPAEAAEAYRPSLRIRFMVRRAEKAIFGGERVRPEDAPGLHLGLRLYRIAMTGRASYLLNEAQRGVRAFLGRRSDPLSPP